MVEAIPLHGPFSQSSESLLLDARASGDGLSIDLLSDDGTGSAGLVDISDATSLLVDIQDLATENFSVSEITPKMDIRVEENMTDLLRGGRIERINSLAKRRLNCFGVVLEKGIKR